MKANLYIIASAALVGARMLLEKDCASQRGETEHDRVMAIEKRKEEREDEEAIRKSKEDAAEKALEEMLAAKKGATEESLGELMRMVELRRASRSSAPDVSSMAASTRWDYYDKKPEEESEPLSLEAVQGGSNRKRTGLLRKDAVQPGSNAKGSFLLKPRVSKKAARKFLKKKPLSTKKPLPPKNLRSPQAVQGGSDPEPSGFLTSNVLRNFFVSKPDDEPAADPGRPSPKRSNAKGSAARNLLKKKPEAPEEETSGSEADETGENPVKSPI